MIPGQSVKLSTFPSGAAMLNVHSKDRLVVLAVSPKCGFGVDEVKDDDGISNFYRYVFKDFESAEKQLWELLKNV
jgi:hypothetical protein